MLKNKGLHNIRSVQKAELRLQDQARRLGIQEQI